MVEKGFRCALIQGYLYGEDVGGLTRSGASYVIWLQVPIGFFFFLVGPKLEEESKIREAASY